MSELHATSYNALDPFLSFKKELNEFQESPAPAVTCLLCTSSMIEKQQVHQTRYWRILIDFKPLTPGHLLIVPKAHKKTIHEISEEEHQELYLVTKQIRQALIKRFGNHVEEIIFEKNGLQAGQSIEHFHRHVLPITTSLTKINQLMLACRLFIYRSRPLAPKELEKIRLSFEEIFKKL